MTSVPRIFITHASANDPLSMQALDEYAVLLEDRGFVVLRDSLLREGDWFRQLVQMMCEAHGAIILLGRRALADSAWIPAEGFLFRVRQFIHAEFLDTSFPILPILLTGTSLEDVKRSLWLEPAQLSKLTCYQEEGTGLEARSTLVSDQLLPALDALKAQRFVPAELKLFHAHLLQILSRIHDKVLEAVAEKIGLELAKWDPGLERATLLLAALWEHAQVAEQLEHVKKAIETLVLEPDKQLTLAALLFHLWISPDKAEILRSATETRARRQVELRSGLKCSGGSDAHRVMERTGGWLVKRAFGLVGCKLYVRPIADAFDSRERLEQHIQRELVRILGIQDYEDQLDEDLQKHLQTRPILVPLPESAHDLASAIRKRYPGLTLVFLRQQPRVGSAVTAESEAVIDIESEREKKAVILYNQLENGN